MAKRKKGRGKGGAKSFIYAQIYIRANAGILGTSFVKDVVEAAVKIAARVVKDCQARSRVLTGLMQSSWTYVVTGEGLNTVITILNDVDYTIYNEFGTKFMKSKPMLSPALQQSFGASIGVSRSIRQYIAVGGVEIQ